MKLTMEPIGFVRGGRREATKDHWGGNRSRIELDPARFTPDALAGIEQLSHIEVLYYFHVDADEPIARLHAAWAVDENGPEAARIVFEHWGADLDPHALNRSGCFVGVPYPRLVETIVESARRRRARG